MRHTSRGSLIRWTGLFLLFALLLVAGIVPRLRAASALTAQTAQQATLTVSVISPTQAPATQEILLPGTVRAYADTAVYARTSGYIKKWYKDIGANVKQGDVLATILTPELDAQLRQSKANAQMAAANYAFSKTTAARWNEMLKTQSVSLQDAQTHDADMQAKAATLAAAQADVKRLEELVSYESVVAPFDGVITARNVDVGSLVTAGGAPGLSANAGELFHLASENVLRIFGDVPQADSGFIDQQTKAYLTTNQYPGKKFETSVSRDSRSIDTVTRTLHVEFDVNNKDHALIPGTYVQIHIALTTAHPALDVPASAILFLPNGLNIATVDAQNKVVLNKISVGRDFGTHMEVLNGISAGDKIIDNPSDSIVAGETVQISTKGS